MRKFTEIFEQDDKGVGIHEIILQLDFESAELESRVTLHNWEACGQGIGGEAGGTYWFFPWQRILYVTV